MPKIQSKFTQKPSYPLLGIRYIATLSLALSAIISAANDQVCPGLQDWNPETKSLELTPCYCGDELQKLPIKPLINYRLSAACNIRDRASGKTIDLLTNQPPHESLPSGTYFFSGKVQLTGMLVYGLAPSGNELNFFPNTKNLNTDDKTRKHFNLLTFSSEGDELFKTFGISANSKLPNEFHCAPVTLNVRESWINVNTPNENIHMIGSFEIVKKSKFKLCP